MLSKLFSFFHRNGKDETKNESAAAMRHYAEMKDRKPKERTKTEVIRIADFETLCVKLDGKYRKRETKMRKKKGLAVVALVVLLGVLSGCGDFTHGLKSGFSDPVLAEKRTDVVERIIEVEIRIERLKEERDVTAAIEAVIELNGLQGELREIYSEAESKSNGWGTTIGLLLSQLIMGYVAYATGRPIRKKVGKAIFNQPT